MANTAKPTTVVFEGRLMILAGMGMEFGLSKRTWHHAQAPLVDTHGAMDTGIAISDTPYAPLGRMLGAGVDIRHVSDQTMPGGTRAAPMPHYRAAMLRFWVIATAETGASSPAGWFPDCRR